MHILAKDVHKMALFNLLRLNKNNSKNKKSDGLHKEQ